MYFSRGLGFSAVATGLASAASLSYPRTPSLFARQSCSAAVDELVGFAEGTTGGGDGEGTTVSSCEELESAVEAGGVIQISGTLDGCDIIDLNGDTTVIGVGADAGITNGGFRIKEASNVIIRNLNFHNPPEGKDLVSLDQATQVWIDHCDFSSEGITGDKDHFDGLLDITHASDFVTVSWNKFRDHWKGSLVGHSDNNADEDSGHLRVTYHHNDWSEVNSRLPSVRFGTAHIYNSCYRGTETSGINSRMGAQVLVENSSFTNTRRAIVTNLDSDEEGFATERGNLFENSDTDITQEATFEPEYTYTADDASCVCEVIESQAGTGVIA
ncbi:hypothetical protein VUR80DRAFT_9062 [Thermomyces stellatus]